MIDNRRRSTNKNVINKFGKSKFASYIRRTQASTQTDRTIIESRDRNKERVTEKLWLQFTIWYMIFVHTNLDRYLHTYIYIHITEHTNTHIFGMNAFCIFTTHQTRHGAGPQSSQTSPNCHPPTLSSNQTSSFGRQNGLAAVWSAFCSDVFDQMQ